MKIVSGQIIVRFLFFLQKIKLIDEVKYHDLVDEITIRVIEADLRKEKEDDVNS